MGRVCKDYTNQICGIWQVIERDWYPKSKSHETFWTSKCLNCGNISSVRKTDLDKNPSSCNNCKGDIIAQALESHGYITHPINIGETYGLLTVESRPFAKGNKSYCKCRCKCGNIIEVRKDHLLGLNHSRTVSCGCNSISAGELKIKQILEANDINFKMQYRINDFSPYSPFDFAIFNKDNELVKLIEFDGEQHFYAIEHFGGEEKLTIQKERDRKKNEYCANHNICLLRVPYWDYEKLDLQYLLS